MKREIGMEQEKKTTLREVIEILMFLSTGVLCYFLWRFYGQCASSLTFAVFLTSFYLYSWIFDKEFRSGITESSSRIWALLPYILFISVFWFIALNSCTCP